MKHFLVSLFVLAACGDDPKPRTGATLVDPTTGGRMTGGTLVVDVQIGHAIARASSAGNRTVLQPTTPIIP
jgi:hypothetical protein